MSTSAVAIKKTVRKTAKKAVTATVTKCAPRERVMTVAEFFKLKNPSDYHITIVAKDNPGITNSYFFGGFTSTNFSGRVTKIEEHKVSDQYKRMGYSSSYRISGGLYPYGLAASPDWNITVRKLTKAQRDSVDSMMIRSNKVHTETGADPEIFVVDKDNNLIPAFTFLRSKKENPSYYWDGYQAEFAPSAGTCLDGLRTRIYTALQNISNFAHDRIGGTRLTLQNVFRIPLEKLAEEREEFVRFGCSPSFNAYGEESPIATLDARTVPIRSAGGHLHFTLPDDLKTKAKIPQLVKDLDAILGVITVSMFQKWDDPFRRVFYGRAGEYRTPEYGVEYRVLSNAWLVSPLAYNLVFEIARLVMGLTRMGKMKTFWKATEKDIRKCINECDVALAHKILERNSESLNNILKALPNHHGCGATIEGFRRIIFEGFHKFISSEDILSNWGNSFQQTICFNQNSIRNFGQSATPSSIVKKAA